jgi:hypothetical protein
VSTVAVNARLALAFASSDHAGMAEIFVSYVQSDPKWAFGLAAELKELGHTPHAHELEKGGGEEIYGWMQTRFDATGA